MANTTPPSDDAPKSEISPPSEESPWSVESVLSTLNPPLTSTKTASSPLAFMHLIERLKTTPREGWRRFKIPNPESIADHMYRMSILTLLAPPSLSAELNIAHCTRMALIHDMAESLVGDITPVDPAVKEKPARESATMDFLCTKLLSPSSGVSASIGHSIKEIFEEYENASTLDARFVHDIDKLELMLQMVEYERRGEGKLDLQEFASAAKKIELEEVWAWCEEVFDERDQIWSGLGKPLKEGWREDVYDGRDKHFEKIRRPLNKDWRLARFPGRREVNGTEDNNKTDT